MLTELAFTLGHNLHWCVLTISLLLHPPAFSYLFVSALAPRLDMCILAGITLKVSLVVFFIEQMWHFLHLPDSELGGQNVKNNEAKWIWSLNTSLKQCSETFSSQSSLEAVRENSLEAVEWREIWSSCEGIRKTSQSWVALTCSCVYPRDFMWSSRCCDAKENKA